MPKPKVLLVVECQSFLNWYDVFSGAAIAGYDGVIQVEQATWDDISLTAYDSSGVVVSIRKAANPLPGTSQENNRSVSVDFVLLRSVSRGIHHQDSRNLLFGLMHANVPSVNSLASAYSCLERPVVFGALKGIQARLGKDNFPLISQTYYPHHREMLITPDFPIVAKVGHAHAGYGKAKLKSAEEFADFKSLCALHGDYVTVEPFIEWDYDMRIQKIGPYYRGFQRRSPNWKGNTGNASVIEDLEVTPQFKEWVDHCAALFGGLDILGLDLLHSKVDGKTYILELNDTAIGLVHKYEREDMEHIKQIVLLRMEQAFGTQKQDQASSSSSSSAPSSSADPAAIVTQDEVGVLRVQLAEKERQIAQLQAALDEEKGKKKAFISFK
eukprot:TRINITY_DN8057_c0_g1_i1.p1 TRINITY_DN8057_c0_g1~~TRINITY_DN8057_c0_g1_i1.p1  ORF type:complete len:391 (+),score=69.66 TRINITY_DN8057_c0_g1_i1:26-1174(+)